MNVFVSELLNLHRGQGQDILWRDALKCPTEEEYTGMVIDKVCLFVFFFFFLLTRPTLLVSHIQFKKKTGDVTVSIILVKSSFTRVTQTGGLFRLAVGLMQSFSVDQEQEPTEGESPSSSSASPSSASPPSKPSQPLTPSFARTDFTPLMDKLALYFQIRDDLVRDHTKRPFSCVFLVVVG